MFLRPLTYLAGVSSRSSMVSRISKTRFQHVGLGTSPCPVPLVAEKDSAAPEKDDCASGCHTPAYHRLVHVLKAWLVIITVTPSMSNSASNCAMFSGTPAFCHAIRISFLNTESNALCMPHVLL